MTVRFECRTRLEVPPDQAFELSRSIDAHLGSMADSGERAVGGVTSGLIGLGETVTWRARLTATAGAKDPFAWCVVDDDQPDHRVRPAAHLHR